MLESTTAPKKENLFFMKTLKMLEDKLTEVRNEMSIVKKNEMNRISKEFLLNDYVRRFNTTEEIVIGALIGEDHLGKELNRQQREMKV